MTNTTINVEEEVKKKEDEYKELPYGHSRRQQFHNQLLRSVIISNILYLVPQHDRLIAIDLNSEKLESLHD